MNDRGPIQKNSTLATENLRSQFSGLKSKIRLWRTSFCGHLRAFAAKLFFLPARSSGKFNFRRAPARARPPPPAHIPDFTAKPQATIANPAAA